MAALPSASAAITSLASTAVAAAASASSTSAHATSIFADPESPTVVSVDHPYVLLIIQLAIIVIVSSLLSLVLRRLRQPRVISDILAGIILGPTALGRIPGFSEAIFPKASLTYLTLIGNLGLIFFLFLVGCEVDVPVFRRNIKSAGAVAIAGLAIPFGLSWAVTEGLYPRFIDPSVSKQVFGLFVAVAFSITAFPVLARILTELRLLQDQVGVVVLAAGVANDVVGWVLLALSVALAGAGAGVQAVYVLLCAIAWTVILLFIIRPLLIRIIRRSGGFATGPTQATMSMIIVLTLVSADITSMRGFGGFLVGVIIPHDKGFAKKLTERMEDFVSCSLVPLYFTLSGLSTDLGLLNTGEAWAWAICIIVVAFASKFVPCALAGRWVGFTWRESGAIGALMSCKGLVELIVLNIGLQAGILNGRTFAMFVLEALVLTIASTPLTLTFYPRAYQERRSLERAAALSNVSPPFDKRGEQSNALVFSDLEELPCAMGFVKLCQVPVDYSAQRTSGTTVVGVTEAGTEATLLDKNGDSDRVEPVTLDALRLVELTQRTSAVMLASEIDEAKRNDPLTQTFSTFAAFNGFRVEPEFAVVAADQFAPSVVEFAKARDTDMIVVPWSARSVAAGADGESVMPDPFVAILGRSNPGLERSPQHAAFVRQTFADAPCDVAVFVDAGVDGSGHVTMSCGRQHIFFAFEGGPDDRAALSLVVQLVHHPGITATVVRITRSAEATSEDMSHEPSKSSSIPNIQMPALTIGANTIAQDTIYAGVDGVQSATHDELAIASFFPSPAALPSVSANWSPRLRTALSSITFTSISTASPLRTTLARARADVAAHCSGPDASPLLFVAGRGRRGGVSHKAELDEMLRDRVGAAGLASLGLAASSSARAAFGDVATAALVDVVSSLLVVQANPKPQVGKSKAV